MHACLYNNSLKFLFKKTNVSSDYKNIFSFFSSHSLSIHSTTTTTTEGVKTELWPNLADNDGCFWMTWEDFVKYYSSIDVIYAGGDGLDSVNIDIKEEFGILGPCCGFTFGTLKYWACCLGPYKLWCSPQERRGRTLEDIETGTLEKLVSIATGSKPQHK